MTADEFRPDQHPELCRNALILIKEFIEWGAKTGSDRDLFDEAFKDVLRRAGIDYKEPKIYGK